MSQPTKPPTPANPHPDTTEAASGAAPATPDADPPDGADPPRGGPDAEGARAPLLDPALRDMAVDLLGKLFRRGRVEVEKAARKGRERLTLRQLRSDRDRMYQKLGKEARNLLEAGELDHPGIRKGVERIAELERRLQELEDELRNLGVDPGAEEGAEGGGPTSSGSPS